MDIRMSILQDKHIREGLDLLRLRLNFLKFRPAIFCNSTKTRFHIEIDGSDGGGHIEEGRFYDEDARGRGYEYRYKIEPSAYDIASLLMETAEKRIVIKYFLEPTIVRYVTIYPDTGAVSVEDVPQATGMSKCETRFVGPGGRRKFTIPPGKWDDYSWQMPDPIEEK